VELVQIIVPIVKPSADSALPLQAVLLRNQLQRAYQFLPMGFVDQLPLNDVLQGSAVVILVVAVVRFSFAGL
jgi:hypothetical protein